MRYIDASRLPSRVLQRNTRAVSWSHQSLDVRQLSNMPKNKLWWQVLAFALLAIVGIVQIARNTTMWFLAIPISLVAYYLLGWRISRTIQLRRLGYYRGRMVQRSEFERDWVYEEIHNNELRELRLSVDHTDPGTWELFVPLEDKWRDMVPPWARHRRDEIISRISSGIGSDRVRLDSGGKVA